jgi:hypothetical protein
VLGWMATGRVPLSIHRPRESSVEETLRIEFRAGVSVRLEDIRQALSGARVSSNGLSPQQQVLELHSLLGRNVEARATALPHPKASMLELDTLPRYRSAFLALSP